MSVRKPVSGRIVGRDFARSRPGSSPLRMGAVGGLILVACLCAIGLSALRIDILRMRYDLSKAIQEERRLTLLRSQHTAQVETLRDPARLAELAGDLGFGRPERVLELAPQTASRRLQ